MPGRAKIPLVQPAAHCGEKNPLGLLDAKRWDELSSGLDWEDQLSLDISPSEIQRLRRGWHTGRPLASDRFLSKLESALGRRLRPLPIGRPRKAKGDPRPSRRIELEK